jgi:DNA-binding LytR/AlgR family response regulator
MKKTKILIVEDQVLIAEVLRLQLVKEQYIVTDIADSAEKAFNSIRKDPADIVLMDVRLNGSMDGIQAAKKIKEIADIPVIFVTDFNDDFTFKNAKEARPSNYITKPYLIDQVLRAIELALINAPSNRLENTISEDLFIPDGMSNYKRIKVSDIVYLKAGGSYSTIETMSDSHLFSFPLKDALEQIKSSRIVRVHRSYAVNLDQVSAISGNQLILTHKGQIPMSSDLKEQVLGKLHLMKRS